MRKMIYCAVVSFVLSGLLAGCAATQREPSEGAMEAPLAEDKTMQEPAAMEAPVEMPRQESMAVAPAAHPVPEQPPCEAVFQELAARARSTMKTVYGSCQEKRIEANPMWSLQYDGSVRIRVYDAAGSLTATRELKP